MKHLVYKKMLVAASAIVWGCSQQGLTDEEARSFLLMILKLPVYLLGLTLTNCLQWGQDWNWTGMGIGLQLPLAMFCILIHRALSKSAGKTIRV